MQQPEADCARRKVVLGHLPDRQAVVANGHPAESPSRTAPTPILSEAAAVSGREPGDSGLAPVAPGTAGSFCQSLVGLVG
jgi:hypothetical protein